MRKFFMLIMCLSLLAIGSTALAGDQEPTWQDTVYFINDKIERYSDSSSDLELTEFQAFTEDQKGYIINNYFPHQKIKAGSVAITFHWFNQNIMCWLITDFGNMEINMIYNGNGYITIKDPQDLKSINVYNRDIRKHSVLKIGKQLYTDTEYSREDKRFSTNKLTLYFAKTEIAERTFKALKHLQKLHKEKYPKERKKEPF